VWSDRPSSVHAKGKTAALWAPDSNAYLCDAHALGGGVVTLIFEPNNTKEITVKVLGAQTAEERTVPIKV
jgi:hypothetical protein